MINKKLLVFILSFLLIFSALPLFFDQKPVQAADTDYYVSNTGDDSAAGTSPATAWQTIGKVNTELNGGVINQGDDIYFKRGDIFTDACLNVKIGGSSSDWMIIGDYDTGSRPTIDGNNDGTRPVGCIDFASGNIGYIKFENLYINNTGNNVGGTVNAIRIKQDNINNVSFYNLTVEDIQDGSAIIIGGTTHYLLENCTTNNTSQGGIVIYGWNSPKPNHGKVMNCTCEYNSDGFGVHDAGSTETGDYHYFYNCKGGYCTEETFDITSGHNIYIKDCEGYGNTGGTSSSIVFGHDVDNVTVDNFYSHDEPNIGMLISGGHNITIRNSIIWKPDDEMFVINDQSDDDNTGSHNITFYNNDFIFEDSVSSLNFVVTSPADEVFDVLLKNNIFYTVWDSCPSLFIKGNKETLAHMRWNSTYNMYWRDGDSDTTDRWYDNGAVYNFNEWIALSITNNELRQNASLYDPLNELFNLTSGSPAIDAGDWLTTTNGGGTGTTITVHEANYFFPGMTNMPGADIPGDNIFVGSDTNLEIIAVDYAAETITVNRSISWVDGETVSLSDYNSTAPDIGAREYPAAAGNDPPTQSSENPANQSTGIDTIPELSIVVDDYDDDMLTAYWRSNSSGSWQQFATNSSIDTSGGSVTIKQTNSNFSGINTKYWWSVNLTDGTHWTNETYHFTTIATGYWYGINGTHLDSHCGDSFGHELEEALNGTEYWKHDTNEQHWFIIDLGGSYDIKQFRGRSDSLRDPVDVSIYISSDKSTWGSAIASNISTWQDTDTWVVYDSNDKIGRYIKVTISATEHPSSAIIFGHSTSYFNIFDAYYSSGVTITMTANSDIDYSNPRTFNLIKVGNGYNYTGWTNSTSSTLGVEADVIGLSIGYFICLWNETTYSWDIHIQGFVFNDNKKIHQWNVCLTKISTDRTWAQ